MVAMYQETIEHAVDVMNGGVDKNVLLCCVEIVSRILDQREEDYFEMQQLRVPVIEDATKTRIVMIHDTTFHSSMFLQKYEHIRQGL